MHYFGEIINGKMVMNGLGEYCDQYIKLLTQKRIVWYGYMIMHHAMNMIWHYNPFGYKTWYSSKTIQKIGRRIDLWIKI
jgi:hypothetical protein